jgi:hypothetical protein
MQKSIIHKLLLARRLLDLARENLSSANELSLAIGVNLLQDSVEAFLLAVAEHVNAQIQGKTGFEQYIDLIDAKIAPKSLPFRARLLSLNKLRVNSKHFGLAPAQSEVSGLLVTVREFYDEVASSILGVTFASVSLIDLLKEGEAKHLVREAEQAFATSDFEACLFSCRKAIFVRIEHDYDIAPFAEEIKGLLELAMLGRKAPYYSRNKEYIEKNVRDPTDYIVLDHSELDMDLMRKGIDTVSFWNVWRLTPEVYRSKKDSPWVHKRDFSKLESEGLRERAEYVLDTTITMLASADQKSAATRWTQPRKYFVNLKREGAPVYEKATTSSPVKTNAPPGVTQLYVDYSVDALDGSGRFWYVSHYDEKFFLTGYLSDCEVAE